MEKTGIQKKKEKIRIEQNEVIFIHNYFKNNSFRSLLLYCFNIKHIKNSINYRI